MNVTLATKLSIARIILILPILYTLSTTQYTLALILTTIALLTDWLDGHIARKTNTITNLGAFLDHFADKILVHIILLYFVAVHNLSAIAFGIFLIRDFYVLGIRHLVTQTGEELASMKLGKIKFTIQSILLIALILELIVTLPQLLVPILLWSAVAFTILSAIELTIAAKRIF